MRTTTSKPNQSRIAANWPRNWPPSSREVGEDHAAAYELLRISRDLSAQNGDLPEAMKSVAQMEQRFEINAPQMRLETLVLFQKSPDAQVKSLELATQAKQLVVLAIQDDAYDVALEALAISKGAANGEVTRRCSRQSARRSPGWKPPERPMMMWSKRNPGCLPIRAIPHANQIVGIYACLVKGRWESGLPQLAKATDLQLRFLAKLDLASAKSPQELVDLAHQYWDLAEKKPDLEERGLKLRAAYWYAQATSQLPNGLEKIKARKRLAEVIEAYGKEETEKATSRNDIATAAKISGSEE